MYSILRLCSTYLQQNARWLLGLVGFLGLWLSNLLLTAIDARAAQPAILDAFGNGGAAIPLVTFALLIVSALSGVISSGTRSGMLYGVVVAPILALLFFFI